MDLQVRISIETAEMFEELKNYYQKTMGMNFSKSDVLIKAVSDAIDKWESIDWKLVNEKEINIKKHDISKGSLRPKLQVTSAIEEKLYEFKKTLPGELNLRSVTLGVCIKHILKSALLDIQTQENKGINIKDIIEKNKVKYLTDVYSKETQLAIQKFTIDIFNELEDYEFQINKK